MDFGSLNAPKPPERRASPIRVLARQLVRIEKTNLQIVRSIRTAGVATALPLFAWAIGIPDAIIPLGVGALFVGISESNIHQEHRARIMLWTTAWLTATSALGFIFAESPILVVLVSAVVAALSGFVGVAGPRAALVGVLSLVLFTVTVGLPENLDLSASFVAFVGLGGVVQTALFLLIHHFRPNHSSPPPAREPLALWFRLTHPGPQREPYLRHAIGLTIAIVVATAISQFVDVPHEYWIPLTVAWIFKPDQKATSLRVIERVVGTLAAIGLAFLWGTFAAAPVGVLFLIAGVGAYLLLAFLTSNYTIATFGVTTFVLALFAVAGDLYEQTVIFRLEATLVAAAIVLVVLLVSRITARPKAGA
jgi:uncharacterized membrane protein YccC